MKVLKRASIVVFINLIAVSVGWAADHVQTIGGTAYTWKDYTYQGLPGRLYVPPTYDPMNPSPLVMFLHGLGESGSDNQKQISTHMSNLLVNAKNRNFILFAPQSGAQQWWSEVDKTVRSIGKIATDYKVDPTRVYVTGLSAGAYGTLQANRRYSNLFAAYVPLSMAGQSFSSPSDAATGVGRPMWFYAGGASGDATFADLARTSVSNILRAQNLPVPTMPTSGAYTYTSDLLRYTQISNGGHDDNTWNNGAYKDANMYAWMLDKSNPIAEPATNKAVRFSLGDTGAYQPLGRKDSLGLSWNVPDSYMAYGTVGVSTTYAVDQQGNRTSTILEVTKAFYGATQAGSALPSGAPFDANVGKSHWRLHKDAAQKEGQLTFRGLEPGGLYDLSVFASLATAVGNTQYIGVYSAGGQQYTINAANNVSLYTFANLLASPTGDLVLDVSIKAGSTQAILNDVILTAVAVPEPGCVVLIFAGFAVMLTRRRTTLN